MRGATGQRGEMANLKAETELESAELARRKVNKSHSWYLYIKYYSYILFTFFFLENKISMFHLLCQSKW